MMYVTIRENWRIAILRVNSHGGYSRREDIRTLKYINVHIRPSQKVLTNTYLERIPIFKIEL